MPDASFIAYAVLIGFVPASLVLFLWLRPPLAVVTVFLGAALFLPERVSFDVVGLPPFDKHTAPVLCILLGILVFHRHVIARARLLRWPEYLIVALVVIAAGTALTNGDSLIYHEVRLPALEAWDIVNLMSDDLLRIALPFLFGTIFYRTARDVEDLLRIMVIFGCLYSPLIILELALSPQLHKWVYGFHQHAWLQVHRFGGYRPMVFMEHGLAVGLYMCSAALAAIGLARIRSTVLNVPLNLVGPVLALIVILVKSLAAIIYLLAMLPVVSVLAARSRLRVAVLLSAVVVSYPLLRATELFPVEPVLSATAFVSEARSDSLRFRFENEALLLEKALERPIFGWGGFNRNRVFEDGRDVTITDGFWIIRLGSHGIAGFAAAFGLLLLPVFMMARRLRYLARREDRILAGTLAVILAVYAVDLLPNGLFTTVPCLLAGALVSLSRGASRNSTWLSGSVAGRAASGLAAEFPRRFRG